MNKVPVGASTQTHPERSCVSSKVEEVSGFRKRKTTNYVQKLVRDLRPTRELKRIDGIRYSVGT